MKSPSFSDWPDDSIKRLTEIIRQVFKEEIAASQLPSSATHDAKFLASLSKEEYDELIRRQG